MSLPYGCVARLILLYVNSRAYVARSNEIVLGASLHEWLRSAKIAKGGNSYKLVRDQFRRLALCRLALFSRAEDGSQRFTQGSFMRSGTLPPENVPRWDSSIRLDESYYNSLIQYPLRVQLAAVQAIGARSVALDLYTWLAYRLHYITNETFVPWAALHRQFGGGFRAARQFKARLLQRDGPLAIALAAYPQAQVDVTDAGLTLHHSPSPVQPTITISGPPNPRVGIQSVLPSSSLA